jgi:hypothetical protein
MDLYLLNHKCQIATRSAYDDFRHYIDNPLFELSGNVVDIHYNDMKQDIGKGVTNWYISTYGYTELQYKAVREVIEKYIVIALKCAYSYVRKKF